METQKTTNLLNGSDNENSKFVTKIWYIIDNESLIIINNNYYYNYSHENPIKFLTKSIWSSLCDYSDAYILLTGNIVVKKRNAADTDNINITQYLKIVHHLKIVEQKLMILLLIMQILLISQCLCII